MSRMTLVALVVAWLAACAAAPPSSGAAKAPSDPIEIVSPVRPVPTPVRVRSGSFARTRVSAAAMQGRFRTTLESARVFAQVVDAPPAGGTPVWELVLTAADYGEPNAYTFELQALVVRDRDPIASYVSKQAFRQTGRSQLTIGPEQLAQLAERAIRDLVRQLAADAERLSTL